MTIKLGKKSIRYLGQAYGAIFAYPVTRTRVDGGRLYDFLYESDLAEWFCDLARDEVQDPRELKDFVMRLYSGESLKSTGRPLMQRIELGPKLVVELAAALLRGRDEKSELLSGGTVSVWDHCRRLEAAIELDGYVFENGRLLPSESEANEVQEERGELAATYSRLGLGSHATVISHLELSEEHYLNGNYSDCIHNSRQYFEQILVDVATAWGARPGALTLPAKMWAKEVREYLRDAGLLSTHEFEAVWKLYKLLSETGGHPGMSQKDQARIFRRLALCMAQFALLRYADLAAPPAAP